MNSSFQSDSSPGFISICSHLRLLAMKRRLSKLLGHLELKSKRSTPAEDIIVHGNKENNHLASPTAMAPSTCESASNMSKSRLLSLPRELRDAIWQQSVGGMVFHLRLAHRGRGISADRPVRVHYRLCPHAQTLRVGRRTCPCWMDSASSRNSGLLSILLTCRQM